MKKMRTVAGDDAIIIGDGVRIVKRRRQDCKETASEKLRRPQPREAIKTHCAPRGNNLVPLRSDTIRLVQNGCSFHGLWSEDPNQHLKDFLKLMDLLDLDVENRGRMHLSLFQFYFRDQASNWLKRLPARSISTWEDLTTRFLAQFVPSGRTTKLRNEILMFQQHQGESLSKAWTRLKELLQKLPHHGIDLWLQVQIFYDYVNPATRRTIDQSAGKLYEKNVEESWALLEDLSLYDNESWNDPRDFAKLVKAISLPQDVPSTFDHRLIELENQVQCLMEAHLAPKSPTQVKKITSSCGICSGPHDTQYYMENHEQAFVNYASSRNNEVGEKRLSSLGTQLKQQQDDVINKINTLWKVVYEKFDNTPAHNTTGDFMARVNAVIKREGPNDRVHGNTIEEEVDEESKDSEEEIEEETEEEEEDDPEYFDTFPTIEELVEDTNSVIDHYLGGMILGKPFVKESGLIYDKDERTVTFEKDKERIMFKMPHKMERFKHIDKEILKTDNIPPFIITGDDSDQEKTHYSDSLNLGLAYRRDKNITKSIQFLIKMKSRKGEGGFT
ncbi:MAK10-like protein [Tanacetum coccineum]